MTILALETGLFPDGEAVRAALDAVAGTAAVRRIDARQTEQDDAEGWAELARAVLAADRVVTI